MATMQAIRIHGYGGGEQLRCETAPRPSAADGEVLVRVHATTVNPFDTAVRAGYVAGWYPYSFPHILGLDLAGVVEEIGAGITRFAPGDAVYARTNPALCGANAEYVAVQESDVAAMPGSLGYLEAAAIPHSAITAWRALIDAASLQAGQTVLIHGAAGGVGSMAVQLAKWRGAYVIGTASQPKLRALRELGADEQIDYTATRFEDVVRDADVVLDTVGGETLDRSWVTLKPGGIMLSLVQPLSEAIGATRGVRQQFVMALGPAHEVLTTVARLVEQGHVRPLIDTVLQLQQAAQAHMLVDGRHTCGRVVLQVAAA